MVRGSHYCGHATKPSVSFLLFMSLFFAAAHIFSSAFEGTTELSLTHVSGGSPHKVIPSTHLHAFKRVLEPPLSWQTCGMPLFHSVTGINFAFAACGEDSCNRHEDYKVDSGTECKCTCRNKWTGSRCQYCHVEYDPSQDCKTCFISNKYGGKYPNCTYEPCLSSDCSNNALTFDGARSEGCKCYCLNQYTGPNCSYCPPNFDRSDLARCGKCAEGYGRYPDCLLKCTVKDHCNGHADSVWGYVGQICTCDCRNYWRGSDCSVCPPFFDGNKDCTVCMNGFVLRQNATDGSNQCVELCTIDKHCSGPLHSLGVSGNVVDGCLCACSGKFSGLRCEKCDNVLWNQTTCDRCVRSFSGFPACAPDCTLADCNGQGITVSGFRPHCSCSCNTPWTSSNCSVCPSIYRGSKCNECAEGLVNYPLCYRGCSISKDCSGHAHTVTGSNTHTGCVCSCRNAWTEKDCSYCPPFVTGEDCDVCAPGYIGAAPLCNKICDVTVDCSRGATGVVSLGTRCECLCRNGYAGPRCDTCPPPYSVVGNGDCDVCLPSYAEEYIPGENLPRCYLKCTMANCTRGKTQAYSGDIRTGCRCTCINNFYGNKCEICPPQFEQTTCLGCAAGFGSSGKECSPYCTNVRDCNGRAERVSGLVGNCTCTCDRNRGWTGTGCEVCPPQYDVVSGCEACTSDREEFPFCYPKCTPANCSGHSIAVKGNYNIGCTCTCARGYKGPTCADCPSVYNISDDCGSCIEGYANFPNCQPLCNIKSDCASRASVVIGTQPDCECQCVNQWKRPRCASCPFPYDANFNCGACLPAHDNATYPLCHLLCTTKDNCTNRANSVKGNSMAGCLCSCRNSWTGTKCETCPQEYDQTKDCGECAPGYAGVYPACARICTNFLDCNNRATAISNTVPNCLCTCDGSTRWRGAACEVCDEAYDPSKNCAQCSPEFEGTYPLCYRTCIATKDCNNHTVNGGVSGNYNTGCNCTCRNKWFGEKCERCAAQHDAKRDCGVCALGHIDYPYCNRLCNSAIDCTNHASTVSGIEGNCNCTCRNKWSDASCSTCPHPYDGAGDCGRCLPAYDSYPGCYLTCTVNANCSGHAVSVTGNTNRGCSCSCRNKWTNATCDWCPFPFDGSDCSTCVPGYTGYPNCKRICTNNTDCGSRAVAVSGVEGSCKCTCRNMYSGGSCERCLYPFNASADCGECQSTHDTYPYCYLTCTTAANCSAHAIAVAGNTATKCRCHCRNQWTGVSCAQCPEQYDANFDCQHCASGFTGYYPNCNRACISADCNYRGVPAGDYISGCKCTCFNQWSGARCESCASNYYQATCAACAVGYTNYPICEQKCSLVEDCSNNAEEVVGLRPYCNCRCFNKWQGTRCDYCPLNYDSRQECGTCASGYVYYPYCLPQCTIEANCSSNAYDVQLDTKNIQCSCSCRAHWSGSACQICPIGVDRENDCSTCLPDYSGTPPNCVRDCTRAQDCNNRAVSVTGQSGNCQCTCRNQWSGYSCDVCPVNIDTERDCSTCVSGYIGYPKCYRPCSVISDCNNHATEAIGNITDASSQTCQCKCKNQWTGITCNVCPFRFDASSSGDCGRCSDGYEDYPRCLRKCSAQHDCSNRAVKVDGNENSGCICHCAGEWTGAVCDQCPPYRDPEQSCAACIDGYDGYPNCTAVCSTTTDCGQGAAFVSGNMRTGCTCHCRNQWTGPQCELCPSQFDKQHDCGNCAAGYTNYPHCRIACTQQNCSNRAARVSGDIFTGCACECALPFVGPQCQTCPFNYNATDNCQSCADGYMGYPQCTSKCESRVTCVNGRPGQHPVTGVCMCFCRDGWSGEFCSVCPPRYDRFNDCKACARGYYGQFPYCWGPEDYPSSCQTNQITPHVVQDMNITGMSGCGWSCYGGCGFYGCSVGPTEDKLRQVCWGDCDSDWAPNGSVGSHGESDYGTSENYTNRSVSTSPAQACESWYYFGATRDDPVGWYNLGCGKEKTITPRSPSAPQNKDCILSTDEGPGSGKVTPVSGCGEHVASRSCYWYPDTFGISQKADEQSLNTFLSTVGCGVECVKGVIIDATYTSSNRANHSESAKDAYLIDVIVRSSSIEQSHAGAMCLMEVMKRGAYWPFKTNLDLKMPPDNYYVKDCTEGTNPLLPWHFCEPICYRLFLSGDYRCCDKYPNRCYYWNCTRYSGACEQNYKAQCADSNKLPSCINVPSCRKNLEAEWVSTTVTITSTISASVSLSENYLVLGAAPSDDLISRIGISWLWVIILVCLVAAAVLCFIVACTLYRRRKHRQKENAEMLAKLGDEPLEDGLLVDSYDAFATDFHETSHYNTNCNEIQMLESENNSEWADDFDEIQFEPDLELRPSDDGQTNGEEAVSNNSRQTSPNTDASFFSSDSEAANDCKRDHLTLEEKHVPSSSDSFFASGSDDDNSTDSDFEINNNTDNHQTLDMKKEDGFGDEEDSFFAESDASQSNGEERTMPLRESSMSFSSSFDDL